MYSARGWAQFGDFAGIGYTYGFASRILRGSRQQRSDPAAGQNQGGEELKAQRLEEAARRLSRRAHRWTISFLSVSPGICSGIYRSYQLRSSLQRVLEQELGRVWPGLSGHRAIRITRARLPDDFIQIIHAPSVEFSTVERPFSRSNFVYSYDVAAEGVSRNEIGFQTAPIVGRLDAAPYIAWPKFFDGWTFRPQVGARETYYSQRLEARSPTPAAGQSQSAIPSTATWPMHHSSSDRRRCRASSTTSPSAAC